MFLFQLFLLVGRSTKYSVVHRPLARIHKTCRPEIQEQVEAAAGFKPASPQSHLVEKAGHGEAIKAAHANTALVAGQQKV